MATISETELRRKLKRLENSVGGGGSSQVTNIGDNTYEYTNEYTYIAYAATISNVDSGVIQNQSDATGFSFSAISESGTPLGWLGYFTSKSLVQSGDPSDYIWTDLSSDLPASSVIKYYTESTNLLTNIGTPYNLVAGVTWTLFSGSIPASAFWVASRYIINGIETSWYIVPVKTKQSDLGLITYTISGRDKPVMNDSVWRTDALSAISTFTGNAYSTTNEMGFGTVIGITYDNGKLFGMLKKVSGVAVWVVTPTFIDGELLITETIVADKIAANAITASKLSIVGTDDVRTITGSIAGQEAAQTAANNAASAATAAQTTADTATTTLADIADDDKLTPAEKLQAKTLWDAVAAEYSGIVASASNASVSSTAYATAYTNLNTYLNTTPDVFASFSTTTTISRTTWNSRWSTYYGAKQALLDAIAASLKTLADTAQEAADDIADNIYVSNTTTIDGGTISAGTKITAGSNNNVGVLDGADSTYRIYAGHATAASAPFRVSQNGTVTIEQSTSAGKLVIEGDVIKVYTTSGGVDTLRVKLGNLA